MAGPRVAVGKNSAVNRSVLVPCGFLSRQWRPTGCGACGSLHGSCLLGIPVSSSDFPFENVPFLLSAPGSLSLTPGAPDVALASPIPRPLHRPPP